MATLLLRGPVSGCRIGRNKVGWGRTRRCGLPGPTCGGRGSWWREPPAKARKSSAAVGWRRMRTNIASPPDRYVGRGVSRQVVSDVIDAALGLHRAHKCPVTPNPFSGYATVTEGPGPRVRNYWNLRVGTVTLRVEMPGTQPATQCGGRAQALRNVIRIPIVRNTAWVAASVVARVGSGGAANHPTTSPDIGKTTEGSIGLSMGGILE